MTNQGRRIRPLPSLAAAAIMIAGTAVVLAAPPAQAAKGPPCKWHHVRACVDLSRQRAWLMKNGHVVYGPARIASGRKGYRTDRGHFHVTFKDRHHVSSIYHAPMPYSVFYHGGEAFHQGSLHVRSHGCVHLSHKSAKRFFHYLHRGDRVQVHR